MSDALRDLLRGGTPDAAAIEKFIATHEFPLVDRTGITFVYRGAADSVLLRCWIYGLPTAQALERVTDTDLWVLRIDLPPNSRIEYKFDVVRGQRSEWITDPLNPHKAADPYGANSVAQGFGYERPAWTLPDSDSRRGALEELRMSSEALGQVSRLLVYVPARFRRTRRYPLLIVHDGEDYLRFADFKIVLDEHNAVSLSAQLAQNGEQLLRVARVQADRRLVENVADVFQSRPEAGRQPGPLIFAPRQRPPVLAEALLHTGEDRQYLLQGPLDVLRLAAAMHIGAHQQVLAHGHGAE